MNKGTVFIASLGARQKRTVLFDKIISHCPESDYSSVLYITPAAFSLRESRLQFFSFLKNKKGHNAYIPFQSFTLKNFCSNLYEIHGNRDIVSDRIEPLLLYEILEEKNIGYARLLSDLLSKIRNFTLNENLSVIRMKIEGEIFEERTRKQALMAIDALQMYEKELGAKGLVDFESALRESASLIREHVRPAVLVLDGFFDPTPLEQEVIRTIIEKAERTFALIEENAEALKFFESDDFQFVFKKLQSFHQRKTSGFYPFPSKEDEIEGVARWVKGLILDGTNPNEIAVTFPVISKYLPMLRRIFKKHGIPTSIVNYDLSGAPPLVAVEEMLLSVEDDYPRNNFLSFLSSPYFPRISGILKKWTVVFSNKAGIIKGREAWTSIRETLLLSSEDDISPDMKEILDEFQREMKKIILSLEKLKDSANLLSFTDTVESLLDRLGFFDSLEMLLNVSYKDEMVQCFNDLFFEMRNCAAFSNAQYSGPQIAGFYMKQLLKGMQGRQENRDGVRIIPFELAAGLECKALFVGGMIENDLPFRPGIDPLLPENVKQSLGLPFLEYYLDRQKRYFRRILHISSDEPYFSYPVSDDDKVFLPSPFLDWDRSLNPSLPNIFSEEEILVRLGGSRQRDFSCSLWDGKLKRDKEINTILKEKFGVKTFIRVTDIDAYRKCPLRFYIEKFLCLEREKPPQFAVEARMWGKLVHRTMEYLYKNGDIGPENFEKRLFEALELSLKEFPIADFWSNVARAIFRKILPSLIAQETEIRNQGFSPYKVENPLKASCHALKLKGKIDRVDIKKAKSTNFRQKETIDEKSVMLLDYKTGASDKDSLQLPLYVSLWQEKNPEPVEKTGYYSLKEGRVDWYPRKISMDEFVQSAIEHAKELVHAMRKALFTPIPFKEGECRYCSHENLCKKNS
jgi:ATP-dependent helicase/DNAse subunit B